MGALSIAKTDHLLWLGRYVERTYTTLRFILYTYDAALDSVEGNWKGQLAELGFDSGSDDPIAFFKDCLFSQTMPSSIQHSIDAAYGNAVTLRDVIGSEGIAYVQMATDSVGHAATSDSPLIDLQQVTDDIMAFKGCIDDYVSDDSARYVIKCGMSLERMDLYTRLRYRLDQLPIEAHRMAGRIGRVGVPYDKESFRRMIDIVFAPDFPDCLDMERADELLRCLAGIF